eukprot:gene8441-9307_t
MMDEEMEADDLAHNEGSPQARPPPNLIGEINDLIEKERTLLELQLLDKNLEAEEWKRKYESLRLKVSEEETEEVKKILSLGDGSASEEAELQEPQQTATMREIILNRLLGERVADLSNLKFASKASFSSIIKALFGQKSAYPGLRVAWLRNCELSAANAEAIAHLLRSAMVDAVDLSRNNLDDLSFIAIVEALKNRKNTPQYLLLDYNPLGGNAATLLCTMLQFLTETTWGIAVSLPDLLSLPAEANERAARRKANRPLVPNTIGDNNAYKELVKHPGASTDFLITLNELLVARRETAGIRLSTAVAKTHRTKEMGRMQRGIQAVYYLGLTQFELARKTISTLQQTLELLSPTLTDLDLSFCYAGFALAQVLSKALRASDCALIRLALRGNLLGDPGACLILDSLPHNKSLTYLDLSHNCLSSPTASKLLNVLPLPSLHVLDLQNNDLGEDIPQQVLHSIQLFSSCLLVRWDSFSTRSQSVRRLLQTPQTVFLRLENKEKTACVNKRHLLVDLGEVASLVSRLSGSINAARPLRLSFQIMLQSHERTNIAALSDHFELWWEVAAIHRKQRNVLHKQRLHTRWAFGDGFSTTKWVQLCTILTSVPESGRLSVDLIACGEPQWTGSCFSISSRLISLHVLDLSSSPWFYHGGDGEVNTKTLEDMQAKGWKLQSNVKGKLLRAIRYMSTSKKAKLVFEAQLVAENPEGGGNLVGSGLAKKCQYDCFVYVQNMFDTRLITTLPCPQPQGDETYVAWKSSYFEVELDGLKYGDRLLLVGDVTGALTKEIAGQVQVRARKCQLFIFVGDIVEGSTVTGDDLNRRLPYLSDDAAIYTL